MKFLLNSDYFKSTAAAINDCFLLTNGLGGYTSLNCLGGTSRGDHALLMAAVKAPNVRWNMVTNILMSLTVDGRKYILNTDEPECTGSTRSTEHRLCPESFTCDNVLASWCYKAEDVKLIRSVVLVHGENTLLTRYHICNPNLRQVKLILTPLLRFTPKNESMSPGAVIIVGKMPEERIKLPKEVSAGTAAYEITGNGQTLYCLTDGSLKQLSPDSFGPLIWPLDTRDGRQDEGYCIINHTISCTASSLNKEINILYSMEAPAAITTRCSFGLSAAFDRTVNSETQRMDKFVADSGLTSTLGMQLAASADAYIVNRFSTGGKTIIAGYPFFGDWGRDTMIALGGLTLVTGRFEECRSILKTFAKYVKNGLLPNLFPEGDETVMYNSVDAPLLFINAVYEYIHFSGDKNFLFEVFEPMREIISAYENGTDFHIRCDSDGLITAGDGLEQLTWMDVRIGNHLPTPRHGKPVEINAYWYSALCCMKELDPGELSAHYESMAALVRSSFLAAFPNPETGCLKDVINGTYEENQIRCNQIWALTMPFTMLPFEWEEKVLGVVERELYTTAGLRTLSMGDENFHETYIGNMESRDLAYHQGTVWVFPLGAYLRARIRHLRLYDKPRRKEEEARLKEAFDALTGWLFEGCLGHLAEIYDGKNPTVSRGCFAQAWSVGEIIRAVYDWERECEHADN